MEAELTVFVVDDDRGALRSMQWLLESEGFAVQGYSSAADFMRSFPGQQHGCVLLDLQMPQCTGLQVQRWLATQFPQVPVVFITGHGDIETCAEAMKAGAMDFLEKPIDDTRILGLVRQALEESQRRMRIEVAHPEVTARLRLLTPREREIMNLLSSGSNMKSIAASLGISIQTVAKHRTRVLEKMKVRNEAELVRLLAHFES